MQLDQSILAFIEALYRKNLCFYIIMQKLYLTIPLLLKKQFKKLLSSPVLIMKNFKKAKIQRVGL